MSARPAVRALALAAALGCVPAAFAEDSAPTAEQLLAMQRQCEARNPPRKSQGTITEGSYRKLERIIDTIGKGQYGEAEQKLKDLLEQVRKGYEQAVVLQTLGFVYAQQNKNSQAIKAFRDTLALEALPQQPHEQMMLNIAQLYVADDKWDDGIVALNAYMEESCNPAPDAHILLASVYAEKKRFQDSLKHTDLALAKAKEPKESWLQLKLALHYEMKQFPKCADVLVRLVALVPDKEDYWKQLSGMLFEIRKDPEALAVLALAERRGYMSEEREFRNLANLYMYLQIPLKAGRVMEEGLSKKIVEANEKNLELAANAWLAAREYEKAEVAMRRAAEAADKGELWKRLGEIYIEQEDWKAALEALSRAERKGGVKEPGQVSFLIGVASVQVKDWKRAEQALRNAMTHDKTARMAADWLVHLEQELAFHEQLKATAPDTGEN